MQSFRDHSISSTPDLLIVVYMIFSAVRFYHLAKSNHTIPWLPRTRQPYLSVSFPPLLHRPIPETFWSNLCGQECRCLPGHTLFCHNAFTAECFKPDGESHRVRKRMRYSTQESLSSIAEYIVSLIYCRKTGSLKIIPYKLIRTTYQGNKRYHTAATINTPPNFCQICI